MDEHPLSTIQNVYLAIMKLLIVCQYFYPEEFKVNDLAEEFVKKGHQVTVLTGKPNYPRGKFFDGYKFWGIQKEKYKGADIIRVPLIRRAKGNGLQLIINYLSFVFFGNLYAKFHKIDADYILCFEQSPITQVYPALVCKKKEKCKLGLWVQDLWPESIFSASNIKQNNITLKLLTKAVSNIYKKVDTIFVQSPAFSHSINSKGDFNNKIVYLPNWAEDIFCDKYNRDGDKYKHLIPKGFIIMFAGNLGVAQDCETLIKSAVLTKEYPDIKWVFIGDGRKRQNVEQLANYHHLQNTVFFLGRFPVTEMPCFFSHADVMLVSLKDEYIFSLTIPSKIQSYMAFGKPIASMMNGIGNEIISKAECGLTANAGDAQQLADNIIQLYKTELDSLEIMGKNAEEFYQKNFSKNEIINRILSNI